MKYTATFKTSYQITQDDFVVANPVLVISDDTTIGEIKEWYSKKEGNALMEVRINEVQHLTTK